MENLELKVTLGADEFIKSANAAKAAWGGLVAEVIKGNKVMSGLDKDINNNPGKALDKIKKEAQDVNRELIRMRAYFHGISYNPGGSGPLFTVDIVSAARSFAQIIEGAIGTFVDGVKYAAEVLSRQDKINLSYGLALGGPAGKSALKDVERFADLTSFSPQELQAKIQTLYKSGFQQKQVRDVLAAGLDISALSSDPTDINNVDTAINFAKMARAKEGITKRYLLGVAQQVGFTVEQFYEVLGKELSVSAKEAEKKATKGNDFQVGIALRETFLKLVEKKLVDAGVSPDKYGRILGQGGVAESKTIGGALHKVGTLPQQLISQILNTDAGQTGAGQLVTKLYELYDYLKPSGEGGAEIFKELKDIFSDLVKDISAFVHNKENLRDAITGVGEFLKGMAAVGKALFWVVTHLDTVENALLFFSGLLVGPSVAAIVKGTISLGAQTVAWALNTAALEAQTAATLSLIGAETSAAAASETAAIAIGTSSTAGLIGALGLLSTVAVGAAALIAGVWGTIEVAKDKYASAAFNGVPLNTQGELDKTGDLAQGMGKFFDFLGVPDFSNDASAQGIKNRANSAYPQYLSSNSTQAANPIQVNAPVTVNITSGPGEEVHSHQTAGQVVSDHIVRAVEQAAQQSGQK